MNKVQTTIELLRKRISHADFALERFSGERRLAEEMGVSRVTIRAALKQLIKDGVLTRNGNRHVRMGAAAKTMHREQVIGFVTPASYSSDYQLWKEGVIGAVKGRSVILRPVTYAHWGDKSLSDALAGFDGMFFIPPSERIPKWLAGKMRSGKCRVVVLDEDETDAGLASVVMFSPEMAKALLDHLVKLGHRRIDCINTQVMDPIITGRINYWRKYLVENKLQGQLYTASIMQPMEAGYIVVRDALRAGQPFGSALFCTTGPAAIGVMRALHEAGLEIGRAVSVCAMNDEGLGRYMLKTLTALESPPRAKYLKSALGWMLSGKGWSGPRLIQPKSVPLFIGESTGRSSK